MTLNNSRSVINLKITRRISIILLLAFLLLTYVARIIKYPVLGMSQLFWTILIVACFAVIVFLPVILNFQYVYYSDEGDRIVFRYYTTGFIAGKKNSIEINKRTFSGFTFDKKLFGLIQSVTLYQQIRKNVAKYPPVHISGLKRVERAKIIKSLSSFAPRIKGNSAANMS